MKFPSLALKSIPSAARAAVLPALLVVFLCVPAAWGQVGPAFVIDETLGADAPPQYKYLQNLQTAAGGNLINGAASSSITMMPL